MYCNKGTVRCGSSHIILQEVGIFPTKHEVYDDKKGRLWVKHQDHRKNVTIKYLGNAVYIVEITKVFETKIINLTLEFLYGANGKPLRFLEAIYKTEIFYSMLITGLT